MIILVGCAEEGKIAIFLMFYLNVLLQKKHNEKLISCVISIWKSYNVRFAEVP